MNNRVSTAVTFLFLSPHMSHTWEEKKKKSLMNEYPNNAFCAGKS